MAARVRIKVECVECGKKYRVSPNASPECPTCGGTDYEVRDELSPGAPRATAIEVHRP